MLSARVRLTGFLNLRSRASLSAFPRHVAFEQRPVPLASTVGSGPRAQLFPETLAYLSPKVPGPPETVAPVVVVRSPIVPA